MTEPDTARTPSAVRSLPPLILVVGLGLALLIGQTNRGFGPVGSLLAVALWLAAWTLATLGAGRPLLRWSFGDGAETIEDLVLATAVGSSVLVGVAAVLSALGWFRPRTLLAVLVVFALAGAVDLGRRPAASVRPGWRAAALAAPWLVALLVATTVTTFYDQWHQHLGFPWLWLRAGSIGVIPRNFYSYMPVNSSLLYAYGLGSLGAWSAQVIHWWSGLLTVTACGLMGRRLAGRRAGWWAALVMGTTPTVLHVAASGGSDLMVTYFAAAAWLALLRTADDNAARPQRWWLLSGALAGMAAGTKYTALGTVAIPLAAGAIVLHMPRDRFTRRKFGAGATAAVAGAAVTFGPWVIRNLIAAGAPFFPFLIGPFRGLLRTDPVAVDRFGDWISGFDFSLTHVVDGLSLGTWTPPVGEFAPAGLLWLGAGLAALLAIPRMRRPAAWALAAGSLAGISFWLVGLQVVRYLLPALVPAAAVLGGGLSHAFDVGSPPIRRALTALLAAAVAWNLAATLHPVGFQRLGCTLGVEPVEPLLARWVSSSLAFDAVRTLPKGAKILLVAESRALGFDREVEIEHPFGETRLEELARLHDSPEAMAAALGGEGFTHVLTNRWEAQRIADMRRRTRYFVHADEAAMARLDGFARHCLEPVWLGHGVAIYRLDPSCTSSGAGDLASW